MQIFNLNGYISFFLVKIHGVEAFDEMDKLQVSQKMWTFLCIQEMQNFQLKWLLFPYWLSFFF